MSLVYFTGCQSGPYLAVEFVFCACSEPRNHTADCDNDHIRYEADDLVCHLLVTLERYGETLDELAGELNAHMK